MFSYIYLFTPCVLSCNKINSFFFQLDFGLSIHEFHIRIILQQANPGELGEITLLGREGVDWIHAEREREHDDGLL